MKRSYQAWIVEAAWRVPGGRGLATASYVYSKTKGSVEMTEDYGKSNDFDMYPGTSRTATATSPPTCGTR